MFNGNQVAIGNLLHHKNEHTFNLFDTIIKASTEKDW